MKALFYFLKREFASVLLVLLSFIPLFFIGSLLDILLTHLYAYAENGKPVLPTVSQWFYESIAGNRFLPQEIMACFWILMVLCFILNALTAKDQQHFRIQFVYSFLFIWVLAITAAAFTALACAVPFDLLLTRIDEHCLFCSIINIILVLELMLIFIVPISILIWRKARKTEHL